MQIELRLGRALVRIRSKYKGLFLKQIEDNEERDIVRRARALERKYRNNLEELNKQELQSEEEQRKYSKANFVQKYGNEKMGKMILNLIKTKNATQEQVKEIADFYGVDLEKVKNIEEER